MEGGGDVAQINGENLTVVTSERQRLHLWVLLSSLLCFPSMYRSQDASMLVNWHHIWFPWGLWLGPEWPSTAHEVLEVIYLLERKEEKMGRKKGKDRMWRAVSVNGDGCHVRRRQRPCRTKPGRQEDAVELTQRRSDFTSITFTPAYKLAYVNCSPFLSVQ